jgi:hypothetical protein
MDKWMSLEEEYLVLWYASESFFSNRHFLPFSGDSKGYGFVEYTTKEAALQAKNMLDGKQVENWILCCDWLDSSHITFDSLHSKCLYVDKLPKDFRDMGEFRKVFGSVVNPPYCQVCVWQFYVSDAM